MYQDNALCQVGYAARACQTKSFDETFPITVLVTLTSQFSHCKVDSQEKTMLSQRNSCVVETQRVQCIGVVGIWGHVPLR